MTGDQLIQIRSENVQIGLVPARGREGVKRRRPLLCSGVSAVALLLSLSSGAMP